MPEHADGWEGPAASLILPLRRTDTSSGAEIYELLPEPQRLGQTIEVHSGRLRTAGIAVKWIRERSGGWLVRLTRIVAPLPVEVAPVAVVEPIAPEVRPEIVETPVDATPEPGGLPTPAPAKSRRKTAAK